MAKPTLNIKDFDMLVRIVREAQLREMQGDLGGFLNFVRATQPQSYPQRNNKDPARHTLKVLHEFVAGLKEPRQLQMIKRHQRWEEYDQQLKAGSTKLDPTRHKVSAAAPSLHSTSPSPPPPLGIWDLVYRTQQHADFDTLYSLPSHSKHWRLTRWTAPAKMTRNKAAQAQPRILAVDCEMCHTTKGPRELLGVSVVNCDGKTLLRALVQPRGRVLDLKTHITGVTEQDLQVVTTSCHQLQDQIRKLCTEGPDTVLVGHSLHHDLTALRLDHRLIIDTALLYKYKGLDKCTPSLADLAERVAEFPIRSNTEVHSSTEDALATMKVIQHALKHGIQPLEAPEIRVPKEQLCRLFMHRVPAGTTEAQITALFSSSEAAPLPSTILGPTWRAGSTLGSAEVEFASVDAANLAFKHLKCHAQVHKDVRGRPQKGVLLPLQSTLSSAEDLRVDETQKVKLSTIIVLIRKNACHGGLMFHSGSTRKSFKKEERKSVDNVEMFDSPSKKLKTII